MRQPLAEITIYLIPGQGNLTSHKHPVGGHGQKAELSGDGAPYIMHKPHWLPKRSG
jgi:hypothetical protein